MSVSVASGYVDEAKGLRKEVPELEEEVAELEEEVADWKAKADADMIDAGVRIDNFMLDLQKVREEKNKHRS